jgi:hypothetical protein
VKATPPGFRKDFGSIPKSVTGFLLFRLGAKMGSIGKPGRRRCEFEQPE